MEWLLECVLVALLAATLFHALRLERALGVLQRDRDALEQLVETFNTTTHQAEQGIERLRLAADSTGRQIARQTELAVSLKDDLQFLSERGGQIADRLDASIRAARPSRDDRPLSAAIQSEEIRPKEPMRSMPAPSATRLRSQAERDLLRALRSAR